MGVVPAGDCRGVAVRTRHGDLAGNDADFGALLVRHRDRRDRIDRGDGRGWHRDRESIDESEDELTFTYTLQHARHSRRHDVRARALPSRESAPRPASAPRERAPRRRQARVSGVARGRRREGERRPPEKESGAARRRGARRGGRGRRRMTAGLADDARARDRRIERSRRSLELLLDTFFRPGLWAARLSYSLGLQGRVRSATHMIDIGRTPLGRAPLRLAFASDFHAGATTHPKLLAAACDALADFEPDVLLLGGDFVSVRAAYIDRLAPHLARIRAPDRKSTRLNS